MKKQQKVKINVLSTRHGHPHPHLPSPSCVEERAREGDDVRLNEKGAIHVAKVQRSHLDHMRGRFEVWSFEAHWQEAFLAQMYIEAPFVTDLSHKWLLMLAVVNISNWELWQQWKWEQWQRLSDVTPYLVLFSTDYHNSAHSFSRNKHCGMYFFFLWLEREDNLRFEASQALIAFVYLVTATSKRRKTKTKKHDINIDKA